MENILSDYAGFDCLGDIFVGSTGKSIMIINRHKNENIKTKSSSRLQRSRLRTNK